MVKFATKRSIVGLVWVLGIIALGTGQAVLQNTAEAQRAASASAPQDPRYFPPGSPGWRIEGSDTLGAYVFYESSIAQPGSGPVPHRHSREDETFYVLDGQMEFRVGERIIVAAPGSVVFAPRGIPHAFKNTGTTPAKYLIIISPPGFEKFLEERTALGKEVPTTDPSYAGRYKALTEKYGVEYSSNWSFPPKAAD